MGKRVKKPGSLARKLNLRLTLRLLLILLALDAALFAFASLVLDIYMEPVDIWLVLGATAGVELLVLLLNALQNAGLIRRTLRPLTDLSAATARLSGRAKATQGGLSDLADRLEDIDAGKLSTRLPLEGPAELRELTAAINAMLERLDEAYAAQTRFVSDASHELRTPISVIQGYASLLDRWGKDDPATRQEAIDAIAAEAGSMRRLIEQLLFLARGDSQALRVERQDLDATEVAAQVLKETAMIDRDHPLRADWSEGVPLKADPTLLKEALRVLVDNACKYTPAGSPITLRVAAGAGEVRFAVTDLGPGIAPEDLPHLFERFYRSDDSRTRQTGGSGLGLSIAAQIARSHGGSLEVTSAPGLGARFTLALPQEKIAGPV